MKIKQARKRMRAAYTPPHAQGDWWHKDVEHGNISSWNDEMVFVKFDKQTLRHGWDGTTAQACYPRHLSIIGDG